MNKLEDLNTLIILGLFETVYIINPCWYCIFTPDNNIFNTNE